MRERYISRIFVILLHSIPSDIRRSLYVQEIVRPTAKFQCPNTRHKRAASVSLSLSLSNSRDDGRQFQFRDANPIM